MVFELKYDTDKRRVRLVGYDKSGDVVYDELIDIPVTRDIYRKLKKVFYDIDVKEYIDMKSDNGFFMKWLRYLIIEMIGVLKGDE